MDAFEAQERINLLLQQHWSFAEIRNWFGVDLSAEPQRLLAQYRIWAEQYRSNSKVLDMEGESIHRNLFELFLQHRGLTAVRSAAIQWGMDQVSFQQVLSASLDKGFISEAEAKGDFQDVYRASLIADFHKRFPKLERMTFVSYSGFISYLHKEIKNSLNVSVNPLFCLTSQALGEEPLEYAYSFDSITNEPMGIGFNIWLETKKPIQLRPDLCSWITYVRFEEILKDHLLGQVDDQLEKNRDAIRKYLNI